MAFVDRLRDLGAQFPDLRAQPGLLVALAQSTGSDNQIRDAASFAQATSWRRVLEAVPADHAQAMWDQLPPTDRQRVLGSGYRPVIEQNEGVGFWAATRGAQPNPNAMAAAFAQQQAAAPEVEAAQFQVPAPELGISDGNPKSVAEPGAPAPVSVEDTGGVS